MKYIAQRGENDCGIAALAMATGRKYTVVEEALKHVLKEHDGLPEPPLWEWLFLNGFAWQRRYRYHRLPYRGFVRDFWPPEPWAPSHLVSVTATEKFHLVAMDAAGRVFDPFDRSRKTLTHPDYKEVHYVLGLWPVSNPASDAHTKAGGGRGAPTPRTGEGCSP